MNLKQWEETPLSSASRAECLRLRFPEATHEAFEGDTLVELPANGLQDTEIIVAVEGDDIHGVVE